MADRYRTLLADLPVRLPPAAPPGWRHAYHLFVIRVDDRLAVYDSLHAAGIGVQVHFVPIYRHALYAADGFDPNAYPNTEAAYAHILSLPLYPDLTEHDQDLVVRALKAAL